MSKKLWIGLFLVLAACFYGLKPYLNSVSTPAQADIATLTDAHTVARWVLQHQQLPDYYLTKNDARLKATCVTCCQAEPSAAIALRTVKSVCPRVRAVSGMKRM